MKAVHDRHLDGYLASLGLATASGGLGKCKFCRESVTRDNLAALFPESGDLKLVCDRPRCLTELQEMIREGRVRV